MPLLTIVLGILLTLLGVIGYFATGQQSFTAFIPSFFGIVLLLLGALAAKDIARKMLMHIAVGVAVLGLLGSARGVMGLPDLFTQPWAELDRPAAVVSQSVMAVACLIYVIAAVASFVKARRGNAPAGTAG
jgi:hypothetical protein